MTSHLDPLTPTQPAAEGSALALAILYLLAHLRVPLLAEAIAAKIGADVADVAEAIEGLSARHRIVMQHGGRWTLRHLVVGDLR